MVRDISAFIAGYCNERFGDQWHVGPEQSLAMHSGERSLPLQLQVWAPAAGNQSLGLPHGTSLFLYKSPRLLPSRPSEDADGLRLVELESALVAAGPAFFTQQPLAATIALRSLGEGSHLVRTLLEGSHSVVAGRPAGALRALGRPEVADEVVQTMRSATYTVNETNPFEQPVNSIPGGRPESPYVQRIRLLWADMRQAVIDTLPAPTRGRRSASRTLADVEARYVTDAYHSLSIEGYRVTPQLVEQVRQGQWNPDGDDQGARDAMAARGYFEAHNAVKDSVSRILEGMEPGEELRKSHGAWYRALFAPSVQAGVLRPQDLAGYRNDQVFIREALHVPLSKEAVRETMPVLFELISNEAHPAARAVLGHFLFVYIHPYMDGNGRLGRFVMNALLVTSGYPWTVIPVEQRKAYMSALEQASTHRNIVPLAKFIGGLVAQQRKQPLARPSSPRGA
ncbi:Fic family protein [Ramlibacter sp.]|uniref:Fic family protein n=1 Tax=Ramlibacter sp. TaxID=1917967 RepID=UPI003D0D1BEF